MSPLRGPKRGGKGAGARAQAWITLLADDPEAASALAVARARLAEGQGLEGLRRLRLVELHGELPVRADLEALLHRSTWFYNPHKERCALRVTARESAPLEGGEVAVRVMERGGERRAAAERWWRHETGQTVEVREGVVWALRFEPGVNAAECARGLAELTRRGHGLLCNPHAQAGALAVDGRPPLPWLEPGEADAGGETPA